MDVLEPAARELLAEFPSMLASVIAERVGWTRSGWFRERLGTVSANSMCEVDRGLRRVFGL